MSDKKTRANSRAANARDIRRARARRLGIQSGIWVGIPTLLAIIYYGFIVTPQYESVTTFAIQSNKDRPSFVSAIIAMPSSSGRDAHLVREYIATRDMLHHLNEKTSLIDHYQSDSVDWLSRLSKDASSNEIFEYYTKKVKSGIGGGSGTLTLRVRAFSAEKAHEIAVAILAASEEMVNNVTQRARKDQLHVAERAVTSSEARLAKARKELVRLQGDRAVLDPRLAAKAVHSLTFALETRLVKARAEYDAVRSVLQPNAPKVVAARKLVGSLQYQLKRQRAKLIGSGGKSVKTSIADLEPAFLEKEFSQRAYEASMKALELARIDASRQVRFLVTIAEPSQPDAPTHPRRMWSILSVFVVSILLMGVGSMLIASVREHGKF